MNIGLLDIFGKCTFADFSPRKGFKCSEYLKSKS